MAAAILTLVLAFMAGGGLWLLAGARLPLADDDERNQVLNLIVYVLALLVPVFAIVFYVINIAR